MTRANDHDIRVLNGLVRAALDSADGYVEAARDSDNDRFRALFERRAFERRQVAEDLTGSVRTLGGEPVTEGSILAKAQRAFMDVRHALMREETAVVDAVEAGEDSIKARFERALQDSHVSATTREAIRRAYASVQQGHEDASALKHSLHDQASAEHTLFPS